MFNFFKSRPPIIIINEAENAPPAEVPVKTWWEKHAAEMNFAALCFCAAVLLAIAVILLQLKNQNAETVSTVKQQVEMNGWQHAQTAKRFYEDSIATTLKLSKQETATEARFTLMQAEMKKFQAQNSTLEKKYRQQLALYNKLIAEEKVR